MANHLTPEELSEQFGIDTQGGHPNLLEEHVPIYHGKIDKTLFDAVRGEHDRSFVAAG